MYIFISLSSFRRIRIQNTVKYRVIKEKTRFTTQYVCNILFFSYWWWKIRGCDSWCYCYCDSLPQEITDAGGVWGHNSQRAATIKVTIFPYYFPKMKNVTKSYTYNRRIPKLYIVCFIDLCETSKKKLEENIKCKTFKLTTKLCDWFIQNIYFLITYVHIIRIVLGQR